MLSAAWDWYYGSNEEFLLANCQFEKPFIVKSSKKSEVGRRVVRPGSFENGMNVNIFTTARPKKEQQTAGLEQCANNLKILRHPNILRFIGCASVESEIHLVTERAYPLGTVLNETDAHEICSGLHDIALALQFIHEKASVSHNNISLESIYVTKCGTWKLGDFDYACTFKEQTKENLKLVHAYSGVVPPEEKNLASTNISRKAELGHCRDVYCLGLLVERFSEQIRFSTHLSKEKLDEIINDMTRPDFENRPTVQELIAMNLFKSPYISIVHFLQSITLKNKTEKLEFFKSFLSNLNIHNIFAEVVGRRLAPLILTPIILAETSAMTHVVGPLLTPATRNKTEGILPDSVFATYVIPKIVELFKMKILHVRLALITHFSKYVHLFEKTVLTDMVLPELLHGLGDSNNQLVQASLHALADSVAVVGGDLIVGGGRQKLFALGIPKFDGRALNEKQALAYEAKFSQRKRPKPKAKNNTEAAPPLPATLLELALQRPRKEPKKLLVSEEEAMAKQKVFASSLTRESAHNLVSNGTVVSPTGVACNSNPSQKFKPTSTVSISKSKRPQEQKKKVPIAAEVETWASSDDEDAWPSFDDVETVTQDAAPPTGDPPSRKGSIKSEPKSPGKRKQGKLKLTNAKSRESVSTSSNNSPKHVTLGKEFEIVVKSPSIPVVPDKEADFFADMAPTIKPSAVSLALESMSRNGVEQGLDAVDERSVDSGQGSTVSAAFNIVDEVVNQDGWDDEVITWD
uniref:Protein-associating with the carboxyl-terminal domain of ezrin n=1 Tax=Phallusia mammillata TaxID=59560 RepID=A0A6F9DR31_9ASCI|nr:protein-associating with the carboxyl-terminal domain of ezrin [Phallusia mammillata]